MQLTLLRWYYEINCSSKTWILCPLVKLICHWDLFYMFSLETVLREQSVLFDIKHKIWSTHCVMFEISSFCHFLEEKLISYSKWMCSLKCTSFNRHFSLCSVCFCGWDIRPGRMNLIAQAEIVVATPEWLIQYAVKGKFLWRIFSDYCEHILTFSATMILF